MRSAAVPAARLLPGTQPRRVGLEEHQGRPRRPRRCHRSRRPQGQGRVRAAPAAETAPSHPWFLRRLEFAVHHRLIHLLTIPLVTATSTLEHRTAAECLDANSQRWSCPIREKRYRSGPKVHALCALSHSPRPVARPTWGFAGAVISERGPRWPRGEGTNGGARRGISLAEAARGIRASWYRRYGRSKRRKCGSHRVELEFTSSWESSSGRRGRW